MNADEKKQALDDIIARVAAEGRPIETFASVDNVRDPFADVPLSRVLEDCGVEHERFVFGPMWHLKVAMPKPFFIKLDDIDPPRAKSDDDEA